jgi:rod shape-determining protein MreC
LKSNARQSRTGDIVTVGVLLTLALGSLSLNSREDASPHALDRALLSITVGLQNGVRGAIDGVGGFWSGYIYLIGVEDENRALKEKLRALEADKARLAYAEAELPRLKKALAYRESSGPEFLPARVIGRDTTPSFKILRLRVDRGSSEIKKGMAVISPEGIVGQISSVYGDYADVMLLTDPQSHIDVMVDRNRSSGTLLGRGEAEGYLCSIPYLSREDQVREGDLVVTSGLDQLFPKGLVVGTVTAVTPRKEQPFQEVEVRPAVDFTRLEDVFVLTSDLSPREVGGDK